MFTAFAAGMVVERSISTNDVEAADGSAPEAFDQAWDLVHNQYVDPSVIDDDAMLEAAVDAMLETLHDEGHTRYLTAEEAQAEMARRFAADGLEVDHWPIDLAVIDDTQAGFAGRTSAVRTAMLAEVRRALRPGGRVEVVEGLGSSGLFAKATARPGGYEAVQELEAAGFRPVRVLAEVPNFRFVEGLRL
jgi:hypothetical protein